MPSLSGLIADAVNPTLAVLLLAAPFAAPRRVGPPCAGCWEFWLRSGLGIGLAVGLAEAGKHWEVWRGHPSFPSGHESFCLAAAVSLAVRDPRWLGAGLPLAVLLAWALVDANYHRPVDIAGAFLLAPPVALLCQGWGRKREG